MPDADFYCISLFKESAIEYESQDPLGKDIKNIFLQTKYININNNITDHEDTTKTSGYANRDCIKYYSEGLNYIFNIFKDNDELVMVLAEDHYFTNGKTIQEIIENYNNNIYFMAPRWGYDNFNASLLCINFFKLAKLFPITEIGHSGGVESHLVENFTTKIPEENIYIIKNRLAENYMGDGRYTNSSKDIYDDLILAGIINE
jgi:hypothetical protein